LPKPDILTLVQQNTFSIVTFSITFSITKKSQAISAWLLSYYILSVNTTKRFGYFFVTLS